MNLKRSVQVLLIAAALVSGTSRAFANPAEDAQRAAEQQRQQQEEAQRQAQQQAEAQRQQQEAQQRQQEEQQREQQAEQQRQQQQAEQQRQQQQAEQQRQQQAAQQRQQQQAEQQRQQQQAEQQRQQQQAAQQAEQQRQQQAAQQRQQQQAAQQAEQQRQQQAAQQKQQQDAERQKQQQQAADQQKQQQAAQQKQQQDAERQKQQQQAADQQKQQQAAQQKQQQDAERQKQQQAADQQKQQQDADRQKQQHQPTPPVVVKPNPPVKPPVVVVKPDPGHPARPDQHQPQRPVALKPSTPIPPQGGKVIPAQVHRQQAQAIIANRRSHVDQQRKAIAPQIQQRLGQLHTERATWRDQHHVNFQWDVNHVHSDKFWAHRYGMWFDQTWEQPPVLEIDETVVNDFTMPDITDGWTYLDVGVVAMNLELLTEQIYTKMDQVAPESDYGTRLRGVLAQLEAAAALFSDDVNSTDDWSDTLNDLFNLESATNLAVTTLDGYSQAGLVAPEMSALEQYVNELLYIYRMNY